MASNGPKKALKKKPFFSPMDQQKFLGQMSKPKLEEGTHSGLYLPIKYNYKIIKPSDEHVKHTLSHQHSGSSAHHRAKMNATLLTAQCILYLNSFWQQIRRSLCVKIQLGFVQKYSGCPRKYVATVTWQLSTSQSTATASHPTP